MPLDEPPLAEGTGLGPLRVLVAMPTPLQCTLVRFFLDEDRFEILPLVPVGADLIPLAAGDRPEALILHERFAVHEGAGLVQGVRRVSPSSKIVVLAEAPEEAWRGPSRGADAYLEEWVGMADLERILSKLCRGVSGPCDATSDDELEALDLGDLQVAEDAEEVAKPRPAPVRSGRRYERLLGAVAAVVILIGLLRGPGLFLATPSTSESGSAAAVAHLHEAYSSLKLLVANMQAGSSSDVLIGEASDLLAVRAAAVASGADVRDLDAMISSQVPSLLPNVSTKTASAIVAVLAELLPRPTPPLEPSPSESPTPSETPSPSQSPSPSPSGSPSPSESPSPSPTGSPSPSESPSASGSPSPEPATPPIDPPSPTTIQSPSPTA